VGVEKPDGSGSAQLVDLYENDCIFDKFDACLSPDGKAIATGTYSNNFKVLSREGASDSCLEASRDPHRKRLQTPTPVKVRLQPLRNCRLPQAHSAQHSLSD